MSRKPEDTADYSARPAGKERPHRAGSVTPEAPHETTQRGVGVDRMRPPQSIRPRKRAAGQPIAVALTMRDPYERASVARNLILAGCSIDLVSSARELPGEATVLVADFDAPDAFAIVDAMRELHPDLPIVAWTARREDVELGLTRMKFGAFAVVDRTSRVHDLVEAVTRLANA